MIGENLNRIKTQLPRLECNCNLLQKALRMHRYHNVQCLTSVVCLNPTSRKLLGKLWYVVTIGGVNQLEIS